MRDETAVERPRQYEGQHGPGIICLPPRLLREFVAPFHEDAAGAPIGKSSDRQVAKRALDNLDLDRVVLAGALGELAEGVRVLINAMFDGTLRQSNVDYGDFDKLHPDYLTRIVDSLGDGKQMMLCWKGGQLVSFQLCLIGHDRIINKQLGMKYPEARELNLFFVNWLLLVRYAIEKRIHLIEMGAATYTTKLLFGGHLERRWLYFRCRSSIATAVVRPFLWLCDFERNDPELRNLKIAVREQNFET